MLKVNWDDQIPFELEQKWLKYRKELMNLNNILISHVFSANTNVIELHGFCDSSTNAYGACIYVRKCHVPKIAFLCAKTKIVPLKPTTMPRLELIAALM